MKEQIALIVTESNNDTEDERKLFEDKALSNTLIDKKEKVYPER